MELEGLDIPVGHWGHLLVGLIAYHVVHKQDVRRRAEGGREERGYHQVSLHGGMGLILTVNPVPGQEGYPSHSQEGNVGHCSWSSQ